MLTHTTQRVRAIRVYFPNARDVRVMAACTDGCGAATPLAPLGRGEWQGTVPSDVETRDLLCIVKNREGGLAHICRLDKAMEASPTGDRRPRVRGRVLAY